MGIQKQSDYKGDGSICPIPRGRYRVRCIGTKFGKSSGGHPMTTLTLEVITEAIEIEGQVFDIAGRQASMCIMHVPSESWGGRVYSLCAKLGIDLPLVDDGMGGTTRAYDDELHKEYFHGMEFDCILSTEEDIARQERKPGQKVGDPILDGEGSPISRGHRFKLVSPDDVPEYCNPTKNDEVAAQPY